MMEKMLRDPNMQKMLYPYLPEPMRNPDSIEWMLNNPEVRKQMEQVFAQSVSSSPSWGQRGPRVPVGLWAGSRLGTCARTVNHHSHLCNPAQYVIRQAFLPCKGFMTALAPV